MDELVKQVIVELAQWWPPVSPSTGDSNTIDVYLVACRVHERLRRLRIDLPTELPDKKTGIRLVDLVETYFVIGKEEKLIIPIRLCLPQRLIERSQDLEEAIQRESLLANSPTQNLVIAFYMWHGYICMAKYTRMTYVVNVGEAPYTIEKRLQGYNELKACFNCELARGNPWVRYGVSLARLLVHKRGNIVIEDWVPEDSPYWQ